MSVSDSSPFFISPGELDLIMINSIFFTAATATSWKEKSTGAVDDGSVPFRFPVSYASDLA